MRKPLCIDVFCGIGGWAEGFLAEGWDVIGFDIERHVYGEHRYPGQLVMQDALTIHGSQFKTADCLVMSPPCQFFSYCAMPWTRAKELAAKVRADPALLEKELALFNACFRIQKEASIAAGRHIPMVVENVRGAIPWVGRSRWNFGSFHLWGDVPALMPHPFKAIKVPTMGAGWYPPDFNTHAGTVFRKDGTPHPKLMPSPEDGRKGVGSGSAWFYNNQGQYNSKSSERKMASAMIAKIPEPLSRYIARTFLPK